MKKLIAKTVEGAEYMHSRTDCFFAERNARAICEALNGVKYKLKGNGDKWHIYDYDCTQDLYCLNKITMNRTKTKLRIREI